MDRPPWFDASLKPAVFRRLSVIIESRLGIRTHDAKLTMVECRSRSRLRDLGIRDFAAYADLLERQGENGAELIHFIDRITTNKTDFFREPGHFDTLVREAVPHLDARARRGHSTRPAGAERRLLQWRRALTLGMSFRS